MFPISAKTRTIGIAALAVFLSASFPAAKSVFGQQKPKITKVKPKKGANQDLESSAEPDKLLYERGLNSAKRGKYTEARLSFQTLINTYPDSEYLAKAKLGIADSYYKEGGTSGYTQAIEEYKNFIVFFPFLDEAAYAQMQVGMAHYHMMTKADRDTAQAQAAEAELQAFLTKFPQNPLAPAAEQRLREVQEVLADGDFGIGHFYYIKGDYRAAAARLLEVTQRYPLYSQSDHALFMLADIYVRARQASKNEDDKNHWTDLAAQCYTQIVREYPLSKFAPTSAAQLKTMGKPIPETDVLALAQERAQQAYLSQHHPNAVLNVPASMVRSSPNVSAAARSGKPNLNSPDDTFSAMEVLKPSGTLNTTLAAAGFQAGGAGTGGSTSSGEPDSSGTAPGPPANSLGSRIAAAMGSSSSDTSSDAPSTVGTATATPAPAEQPAEVTSSEPSTATPPAAGTQSATAPTGPSANTATTAAPPSTDQSAASTAATSTTTDNSQSASQSAAPKMDSKTESTSKKKKGFHKVVPW